MDKLIILAVITLTLILFIYLFWPAFKKLLINSITGITLILLMNLAFGLEIEINWFIFAAVTLFGLPAVGTILILYLGGIIH